MRLGRFSFVEWIAGAAMACLLALIVASIWQHISSLSLKQGIIVDKTHQGSWTEVRSIGDSITTDYHPETWTIIIEGEDSEGKFKRRRVEVSSGTYESHRIGDAFTAP